MFTYVIYSSDGVDSAGDVRPAPIYTVFTNSSSLESLSIRYNSMFDECAVCIRGRMQSDSWTCSELLHYLQKYKTSILLKNTILFIHILTTMYKTKRATTTHVRQLQHAMTMFILLDLRGLGIMHSSRAWIDRPSAYLKHTWKRICRKRKHRR